MTLPTTGPISMDDVRLELGESGSISLGQSSVRNLADDTSGSISMSTLRGKSDYVPTPPPPPPPTWGTDVDIR